MLSVEDDDWLTVVRNIVKVWKVWQRISRLLIREGMRLKFFEFFFKYVV